jgi:hypothetical protein
VSLSLAGRLPFAALGATLRAAPTYAAEVKR